MNPQTQIPHLSPGRFRVGDRVRLRGFDVEGEILEDHGPLRGGNRRFYTVVIRHAGGVEDTIGGYPEEYMEPLPPADGQTPRG